MTVKQVLIGTLLAATAIGLMLHRLPKATAKNLRPDEKQTAKQPSRVNRESRKATPDTRLSLNKVFSS